ncbi:unnamed protein product [Danaus chrysippus]|uniref:(African queen) hypothetical protein n=1 Tax=Danaus chrysippus TaxID=151541 RepID=A0A8J2VQX4_9NEOP|nr:unnamed protein product [Danaus chrysippus]
MSHGRLSQSAILEQLLEEDEEESESELSDQGSENTTTLLQRNLYLLKNQTSRTQKRLGAISHGVIGGGTSGRGRGQRSARARRGGAATKTTSPPLPPTLPLCPHRMDRGQVCSR